MKKICNKKIGEVSEIAFSILQNPQNKNGRQRYKWLTPNSLLCNNQITHYDWTDKYLPNEMLLAAENDILIKRISPSFVNYIEKIEDETYLSNNLIRIRARDGTDSKYLAYCIEQNLVSIISHASKGTVMPSLARQDIIEYELPFPDYKVQKAIGALWFYVNEKTKLVEKLNDLENKLIKYRIKRFLRENKND